MEITCPSSRERRVRHDLDLPVPAADAWRRLREAPYAHYVARLPWLAWRRERWMQDDCLEMDLDVVVSRTLGASLSGTLRFEWHARRMVVTLTTLGDVLCRSLVDVVEAEDDTALLRHDAHLRLPTRLATPFMDAKLERAMEHVADVLRDVASSNAAALAALLPVELVASEGARGERRFAATVPKLPKTAEAVWRHVRLSDLFLSRASTATASVVACVDDGASRTLVLELAISRRLGLRARAELALAFDDDARTLRVTTRACRWGAFDATLTVRADDEDATECAAIDFECGFETRVPLPRFVLDDKLRRLTAQVVHAMRAAVARKAWRDEFVGTFDALVVRPLLDAPDLRAATRFADAAGHLEELLRETVVGGKAYRAMLVRLTVEALGGTVDDRVHATAWMSECFQSCALVADDVMDGSETRRGKPCWYKRVGVPMAINDSLLLFSCSYRLLSHHFPPGPLFDKLARVLFDTAMQTCVGQYLDASSEGAVEHAHAARYDATVLLKTTMYTFHCPLAMGVLLCECADEEDALLENARVVSDHLGQLFQESDDYLDVYGDPTVTGKVGTDIVDGKGTWLMAYARERADAAQREELERLYYAKDVNGEARVRELFDAVGVPAEYARRQAHGARACLNACHERLRPVVSTILAELLHRAA